MSEKAFRQAVMKAIKELDPCPVENAARPGTPDLNCISGWIELKRIYKWPVLKGPVRVQHFTVQQRLWLGRRAKAGGKCWLLLQVKQDRLLLDGAWAAQHLGMKTEKELKSAAIKSWSDSSWKAELLAYLKAQNSQLANVSSSSDAAQS